MWVVTQCCKSLFYNLAYMQKISRDNIIVYRSNELNAKLNTLDGTLVLSYDLAYVSLTDAIIGINEIYNYVRCRSYDTNVSLLPSNKLRFNGLIVSDIGNGLENIVDGYMRKKYISVENKKCSVTIL